jgi:hypothetical protein
MKAWIVVVSIALATASCSTSVNQTISGTITSQGRPIPSMPVALVDRTDERACVSPEPTTTTNEQGQFRFSRTADRGRIAVLVQKDTLCVYDGNSWRAAWKNTYGPAPDRLTFECKRDKELNWECGVKYEYEKQ